jgi:hypothetical protein
MLLKYNFFNKKAIFLAIVTIGFNGCFSSCQNMPTTNSYYQLSQIPSKELEKFFLDIAIELYPNRRDITTINSIIISDFANMHSLVVGKSGRVLTEYLKKSLNQYRGKSIVKIDISNKIKLNSDGIHILTRNKDEINSSINLEAQEFIVNSYDYSGNRLRLFIKRVDAKSQKVIKTLIKDIDLGCESSPIREFILN